MIRILYVSTSTTLGGAEKTLYLLTTSLDPKKFKATGVISVKPEAEYADKYRSAVKIAVHEWPSKVFVGFGFVEFWHGEGQ